MPNYDTWQKHSYKALEIYRDLKDFYNDEELRKLLSRDTIAKLRKAMVRVNEFRSKAEEDMIEKGEPKDLDEIDKLDVWFPFD